MESLRRGWPLPLRRRHSCSQSASPPIICCAHTFPPPWWSSILLRTLEFVFFAEILEWLNKLRYKCPADFNSVYPKNCSCKHTIPNGTQGAAFEISVERLKFSSSIIKALTSTFSLINLVLLRNFSVCPFVLRKQNDHANCQYPHTLSKLFSPALTIIINIHTTFVAKILRREYI